MSTTGRQNTILNLEINILNLQVLGQIQNGALAEKPLDTNDVLYNPIPL
jgi:hypothetical protein